MNQKSGYGGYLNKKGRMNKKGGLTDIFIFMIVAIIIVFVGGIFIYIGQTTQTALHEQMDDMDLSSNASELIDNSFDELNLAYESMYWISILLIVGMIISIFIGNYLVTTQPVYLIPYIFIVIISIVVAVGLSIAYQEVTETPQLSAIFDNFIGADFILGLLPLWVAVIGVLGGVILFTRMGQQQDQFGGFQ